jgi:hypothetical protein
MSHFSKQPNIAGTSLYALIIRVSLDLLIYCMFDLGSYLAALAVRAVEFWA